MFSEIKRTLKDSIKATLIYWIAYTDLKFLARAFDWPSITVLLMELDRFNLWR